jgi:hypothetical protein
VWLLVENVVGKNLQVAKHFSIWMHELKHLDGTFIFGYFWIYVVVLNDFYVDS